jgi:pyrroline-5-carboxylate reductase
MQVESIGFIGGGRITRIMLAALSKAGKLPAQVVVSDANADVIAHLHREFSFIKDAGADNSRSAACDLVFVSLHPPVLVDALQKVKSVIRPNTFVVSLAPKLTLSKLSAVLDRHARIVRMIPNAPTIINAGYNPVAYSRAIPKDEKAALAGLFNALGECPEVPEKNLEAYAVIAAMGPTYLWFQLQALCELGRTFGLADKAFKDAVAKMAAGAVNTMFNSGLSSKEVMDLVPVKPLAEDEEAIRAMYANRLTAMFNKLKG